MSRKIGIVVDSTADFPEGMTAQLGLHVLPVHIYVDGYDHRHGVDISNREVLANLTARRRVHTTPFFPSECADFYETLLGRYERIVSLHLSSHISGNYQSAVSALNLMRVADARRVKVMDLGRRQRRPGTGGRQGRGTDPRRTGPVQPGSAPGALHEAHLHGLYRGKPPLAQERAGG